MADPHCFETEAAKLVGVLGALVVRSPDEGLPPNAFDDYCLMSLLRDQAKLVERIGLDLLFPERRR